MKYNRPMKFFEKLQEGWWWTRQIFDEWCYTMRYNDGEFFSYIQTDHVKSCEEFWYKNDT